MSLKPAPVATHQFSVVRILFGCYLLVHCLLLLPYAPEIFGRDGILPSPSLNYTYPMFPNILYLFDSAGFVSVWLVQMAICSVLLIVGRFRRVAAFALWYGWAALLHRNNLIEDPALPFTGWMLLAFALIPEGEPWRFSRESRSDWEFPALVYWGAWILLGLGYTISGFDKLLHSVSWQGGVALRLVLEGPFARDNVIVDTFLSLPGFATRTLTWLALSVEVAAAPMFLFRATRPIAWIGLVAMHVGIIATVGFADLSIGMLLFHAFVFDSRWLAGTVSVVHREGEPRISTAT